MFEFYNYYYKMTVITGNKSNVEIIILQHEFLNVDLHLDVQAILLINS